MRAFMKVATVVVAAGLTASCGGGGAKNAPSGKESTAAAPGAAAAPSAGGLAPKPVTGKMWEVKMLGDEKGYRFEPKALTIASGDGVKWTLVSGGPHDVTFWADSIPSGGQPQLQANMLGAIGPLQAPMTVNTGETFSASFAGLPPGTYHYFCTPHLALGMVGTITVK